LFLSAKPNWFILHGALVMLFTHYDDAAIGLGCFQLSRSSRSYLVLYSGAEIVSFRFPTHQIKRN
jgi:hypothetical protein